VPMLDFTPLATAVPLAADPNWFYSTSAQTRVVRSSMLFAGAGDLSCVNSLERPGDALSRLGVEGQRSPRNSALARRFNSAA
jgi:hypothetical protein